MIRARDNLACIEGGPSSDGGLSAQNTFMRAIIDGLSAHIAILDADGTVIAVNHAWKRFAQENGYRGTSYGVGESYLSVCESAAQAGDHDACGVASGVRTVISGEVESFRCEYRCDLPDGPRWYQMRASSFKADTGRFCVIAHEDVTEIHRAADAMIASEQQLRAALTAAPIVVFALDIDGTFTLSTGDGLRLIGLRDGEVVGRNAFELYAHEPELVARLRRALQGEAFTDVSRVHDRVWETRYAPLHDARGNLVGTIGAAIDATERYEASAELSRYRDHLESLVAQRTADLEESHARLAQSDRLASLGTLAAGLGHDIANLLLPLRCRLDALESSGLNELARRESAAIRQALQLLQQLCAGLRLCAMDPSQRSQEASTDLSGWWAEVGPVLTKSVAAGVKLAVSLPSEPTCVAIAPHQLSQAVLNLVVNANEALPTGGKIAITATNDPSGGRVLLSVEDNGTGMTPEVRRRAMDPFFTSKKRGRSTGLGLSLVHSMVTSAGGSVEIEPVLPHGTRVTLALLRGGPVEPAREQDDSPVAAVSLRDPRRAALIVQILRAAGCSPFVCQPPEPEDADIWITEPADELLAVAREFLRADSGRRLILYGRPSPRWAELGALCIDDSRGIEGVRETLRQCAARRSVG